MDSSQHWQTGLEQIQLQTVVIGIDAAWALARSAERLFGVGFKARADRVSIKAWKAYEEAANQLKEFPVDRHLQKRLTNKLTGVRAILDSLPDRGMTRRRWSASLPERQADKEPSSTNCQRYDWQRAVLDALLWPSVRENLLTADRAIAGRLLDPRALAAHERLALKDALGALRTSVRPSA
jgi:hypothetical protein